MKAMKGTLKKIKFLFIFSSFFISFNGHCEFKYMLEVGNVWQHRNDVKIPGNSGSRVDFDNFDQGPFSHYRAELFWGFNKNHNVRFVVAPLSLNVKGRTNTDIDFNNTTFSRNKDLEVSYTFNSYRATYFYSFWGNGDSLFNLGITFKVRDAEILFSQENTQSSYDNLGFVPLAYIEIQFPFFSDWFVNLSADGAASSQGRAFDAALKVRKKISDTFKIGIGYRTLEGGADNEKVYTFSWFNYAILDLVGEF